MYYKIKDIYKEDQNYVKHYNLIDGMLNVEKNVKNLKISEEKLVNIIEQSGVFEKPRDAQSKVQNVTLENVPESKTTPKKNA